MSITAVVQSAEGHRIRVASTGRQDNYSDFVCSCGQIFVADATLGRVPGPTLPEVHRAEMVLEALGLGSAAVVQDAGPVGELPVNTIVQDAAGRLMRRRQSSWLTQDGRRLASVEPNGPIRVLWLPAS